MIVTAMPARPMAVDMFTDITTIPVIGMQFEQEGLAVEFASDLTPLEVAAVIRRMVSRNANEEILRLQALEALQVDRDFLAITDPSDAEILAQVTSLTVQAVGLNRIVIGELDGTT